MNEQVGDDGNVIFTLRDVLLALRSSDEDEDVRFLQWDIGRLLSKISPDERALILFYAAGYELDEAGEVLNMNMHVRYLKRKFNQAINKMCRMLNEG